MSLPSIPAVAQGLGVDLHNLTDEEKELVLVGAMRIDLGPALSLLHKKAHEAKKGTGSASWIEDPASDIGNQLKRIHAGDVFRALASKHFCHGLQLSFFNCCNGVVGIPPEDSLLRQIQSQVGPIAFSDC